MIYYATHGPTVFAPTCFRVAGGIVCCPGSAFLQPLLRDVLIAAALPARDRALTPFDRGSHHAATLSWADSDAASTNADGGVIAPTIPIVSVVAIPPDLNVDALGHLEFLGLRWSSRQDSRQHRGGCRYGKSDLHHPGYSLA